MLHRLPTMTDEPWYKDGLPFRCTGCGNCCTGPSGYVWVSEEEIAQIAELRQTSIGEIRIFHTRLVGQRVSLTEFANGDCTFFDPQTRKCSIYSARPTQCRTWPFWRSNLQSQEVWEKVQAICPGSQVGDWVSLEQIESQADEFVL